jgi:hypothetical protein
MSTPAVLDLLAFLDIAVLQTDTLSEAIAFLFLTTSTKGPFPISNAVKFIEIANGFV